MLNIPEDVYEFNILSHSRSASHKKCRHRKWYQWFRKPHYKNVKRLPKEKPSVPCEPIGNSESAVNGIENTIEASTRALSASHESIPDSSTPVRHNVRKVRIDEVPYEIGTASSESGNDSTLIETPTTVKPNGGFFDNNRRVFDDSHNPVGDTTLLIPNMNARNVEANLSNRDSFISADDFQSVSSLASEEYAPSVTTASMKSVYYSLPSETSSLIQIWQPEGEACS